MKQTTRSFVGMDVHKATISISVAEDGRSGPVRFIGVIPNTPEAVTKMAKQLAKHGELDFCYEARPAIPPQSDRSTVGRVAASDLGAATQHQERP